MSTPKLNRRQRQGYSGLTPAQRTRARRRLKAGMDLMLRNAPAVHYTQGKQRWEGIEKALRIYKGEFPRYADCSSSTTYLYWDACKRWLKKTGDFVNRTNWTWGWTGTQEVNGVKATSGRFLVGDLVQYGGHVAMVYKAGTMATAVVWSHGSERGPMLLPIAYRPVQQVRRYL